MACYNQSKRNKDKLPNAEQLDAKEKTKLLIDKFHNKPLVCSQCKRTGKKRNLLSFNLKLYGKYYKTSEQMNGRNVYSIFRILRKKKLARNVI